MKASLINESVQAYPAFDIKINRNTVEFSYRPKRKSTHVRVSISQKYLVGISGIQEASKNKDEIQFSSGQVYVRENISFYELEAYQIENCGDMILARGKENALLAKNGAFSSIEFLPRAKPKKKKKKPKK